MWIGWLGRVAPKAARVRFVHKGDFRLAEFLDVAKEKEESRPKGGRRRRGLGETGDGEVNWVGCRGIRQQLVPEVWRYQRASENMVTGRMVHFGVTWAGLRLPWEPSHSPTNQAATLSVGARDNKNGVNADGGQAGTEQDFGFSAA